MNQTYLINGLLIVVDGIDGDARTAALSVFLREGAGGQWVKLYGHPGVGVSESVKIEFDVPDGEALAELLRRGRH